MSIHLSDSFDYDFTLIFIWLEFQFNSKIGLRLNWIESNSINGMQICGKGIKNIFMNMVLECFFKKIQMWKDIWFHASLFGYGLNRFQFGTIQLTTMTYGT